MLESSGNSGPRGCSNPGLELANTFGVIYLTTRYFDRNLAQKFFVDLAAARPLAPLATGDCARSASFGRSIYVTFGNERTPDLSCPGGPRAQVLSDDVAAITAALNMQ